MECPQDLNKFGTFVMVAIIIVSVFALLFENAPHVTAQDAVPVSFAERDTIVQFVSRQPLLFVEMLEQVLTQRQIDSIETAVITPGQREELRRLRASRRALINLGIGPGDQLISDIDTRIGVLDNTPSLPARLDFGLGPIIVDF